MSTSRYLDPAVLSKIERLELRARAVVEGFVSGRHRSPFRGFSLEFADYRGYVPGDDLRHLDWRMFARTRRYYVKQYELETNLTCHVLLDVSRSMAYGSPDAHRQLPKLEYAKLLAASLAVLVVRQGDAVGLGLFDRDVRAFLRSSSKEEQVRRLCALLEETPNDGKSDLRAALRALGERLTHRGIVAVISDLFDDPDALRDGLRALRVRGHEVILFHVLDDYELTLPFDGAVQFLGLESGDRLSCHPRLMRKAYVEEVARYLDRVRRLAMSDGVDYACLRTSAGLDAALTGYLAARARLTQGGQAAGGYRT
jgi:uncharacterized protein (DUF58 family)